MCLSNVQRCFCSTSLVPGTLELTLFVRDAAHPGIIEKTVFCFVFYGSRCTEGFFCEIIEKHVFDFAGRALPEIRQETW